MKSKTKSLKRDRTRRDELDCEDGSIIYTYEEGRTIDCFHRLRLTKKEQSILRQIGRLERKQSLSCCTLDRAKEYSEEINKLWETFHDCFKNPYQLDVEYVGNFSNGDKTIAFEFFDYEYTYRLELEENFSVVTPDYWDVVCRKSFYVDDEETPVSMDAE